MGGKEGEKGKVGAINFPFIKRGRRKGGEGKKGKGDQPARDTLFGECKGEKKGLHSNPHVGCFLLEGR